MFSKIAVVGICFIFLLEYEEEICIFVLKREEI